MTRFARIGQSSRNSGPDLSRTPDGMEPVLLKRVFSLPDASECWTNEHEGGAFTALCDADPDEDRAQ